MTSPFESALGDELVTAARRMRRRPHTRFAFAGAAVLASLVAVVVTLVSPQSASADVHVTHENGRIEVLLTDLESDPAEVEDALQAEGLDVTVEGVPTGPSNRGRFTGVVASDPEVLDVHDEGNPGRAFLGFSVPEDWDGRLEIGLGRAAAEGERYAAFTDAFLAGEPLACTGARGQTLTVALSRLEDLDVLIQPITNGVLEDLTTVEKAIEAGYSEWHVVAGTALSATAVIVDVAADGPPPGRDGVRC